MPNVDDIYISGGMYLKGEDFVDADDAVLTISGVEIRAFDDGRRKAILSFEETDRRLVLNTVNKDMVVEVTGTKDTDEWIGKVITIGHARDTYAGKMYDVIRVRPPKRKPSGKKPAFVKQQHDERNPPPPLDDEVPF